MTIFIRGVHHGQKYLYNKYQLNKLILTYSNLILQFGSFLMKGTVSISQNYFSTWMLKWRWQVAQKTIGNVHKVRNWSKQNMRSAAFFRCSILSILLNGSEQSSRPVVRFPEGCKGVF